MMADASIKGNFTNKSGRVTASIKGNFTNKSGRVTTVSYTHVDCSSSKGHRY
jgi:hypothetical protein